MKYACYVTLWCGMVHVFFFSNVMVYWMDPVSIALLCIATVNSLSLLGVAFVEYCTED